MSLGDPATAYRWLGRLGDALREGGFADPVWIPFAADEVESLIELGRYEEAEGQLGWLEEPDRAWDKRTLIGLGRCRALLQAARGDVEGGFAAIDRALHAGHGFDMPFERARTMLALGMIQRRVGQRRAARRSLENCLETFERLPAPLWASKARSELMRIGGRRAASGLTEAEERVARLAAEGRTNREIADLLFLSVRTVESHLSRIYRKLGVRSRTELAASFEPPDPVTV